ncbi:MAG: AIR synthase related protein [Deltaproteobacteria bacterium]|nr:AIR synthase related protein [Deltaproteobacteria bacterium]
MARIRAVFASHGMQGEGEDGDAWRIDPLLATHLTTDVVVEGVDFDRALYPLRFAGHRALAQNLSDLYACDAEPVGFAWSLAIPPGFSLDDVAEFSEGAAALAAAIGCPLIGGDLSSTSGPFVCSITAIGRTEGLAVKRSGARAGQHLWLTRKLGASSVGLRLLRERNPEASTFHAWRRGLERWQQRAVRAHLEPSPFHGLEVLSDHAVAAIDISDGLARDAWRLSRSSKVRLELDGLQDAIDVDAGASVDDALFGGEDWALLFCGPDGLPEPPGCVRVGRVLAGEGVWREGAPIPDRGFDHFGTTSAER